MMLECGHPPSLPTIGAGYATTPTGARICYECCRDADLSQMERGEPIVLYLVDSGMRATFGERDQTYPSACLYLVKNWPGTLTISPTRVKHTIGRAFGHRFDVHHVWFIGPDDHVWYGRNAGGNQVLRCRRTRERVGHA